uniref:LITAF domain-containing protein n=1 Tax=Odontella aurita TaxID=265563 RepID=A0A7S4J793_9STRA|mmetsp:Transcript_40218/g.121179  ORF Transcript_40218/g.121179 Transcript_40218/m.121179 type:complete len:231 (+) Transcript_40218:141-833(+)
MGFFGSKSAKEAPSNVGAELVTGPGAQHVSAPAPNFGAGGGDVEDPPIVVDAWVDEPIATPIAQGNAYATSSPPRMADPPPKKKFLPSLGRSSAPPATVVQQQQQIGAVAVPGPPPDAKKSKIAVAVPEADAKRASLLHSDGVGGASFDRKPAMLDCCPNCQQQSRTTVRTYPNVLTWLAVVAMIILFWPLCWIPLVVSKCKATDHICVKCNVKVGGVKPLEDICEKRRS